jgi:predicted NBD/HSP70 family sugar kinase
MMTPGPIDARTMRRINTAATLHTLYTGRSMTLSSLTRETGLSRKTVEAVLEQSLSEGRVTEHSADTGSGTVGRPARTFRFNPQHALAMGINETSFFIEVAVCDLYGTILGTWSQPTRPDASADDRLAAAVSVVALAFSVLDVPRSKVRAVTSVKWSPSHVTAQVPPERLAGEFPCALVTEDRAKLMAVGEGWRGAAQGVSNYVALLRDDFHVGMGVVIDGRLFRGSSGQAGERWLDGPQDPAIRESLTRLARLYMPYTGVEEPHYASADAATESRVHDAHDLALSLAQAILGAIGVLDPELVVIGGAFGQVPEMLPAVIAELGEKLPAGIQIRGTELGTNAVILGALRHSLDRIESTLFDSPRS